MNMVRKTETQKWQAKIDRLVSLGIPENLIEQQVAQWEETERTKPEREALYAQRLVEARSRITGATVETICQDAETYTVKTDNDLDERGRGSGDTFLVVHPALDGGMTQSEAISSVRYSLAREFGFDDSPNSMGDALESGDELAHLVRQVEASELATRFVKVQVRFSADKIAEIEAAHGYRINWVWSVRTVTFWRRI